MRTHTKETTWIQAPASPNHQQHPVQDASSKQQTKQKYRPNHQQTGLPPHSAFPIRRNTNKQKNKKLNRILTLFVAVKLLPSCPTLCDPTDSSPPGFSIPGILQARTLEWVAISFSNAWTWKVKVKLLSCVWLSVTLWTAAHQDPASMGFTRQEYWRGVPLPSPTLYEAYTNHWTNLRRAENKRKKEFSLEAWEKETSNTIH